MIYDYETVGALLDAELRRRIQSNPRYSLRSFARHLKISPGSLSEILRGRRELSLRSVKAVAQAIGMNTPETLHLLRLAQNAKSAKAGAKMDSKISPGLDQRVLSEQVFRLVSEWYHFAILNLLECEGFEWDAIWIAGRLGISRLQAKLAMDLLLKLKLVEKKNGRYQGTNDHILASSDVPSSAIRAYHRQILEKAIHALEEQTPDEREVSGVGLALNIKHLAAIKREIVEFQDHLVAKYSRGKKDEVYFLEMALFKLTQGVSK